MLEQVQVEVHLNIGRELGPTTPADLAPGEVLEVELVAESTGFTAWSAHPEIGSSEHAGEGGEHGKEDGEHGGDSPGEHGAEAGGELG